MITIINDADGFKKTNGFLEKMKELFNMGILDKYGRKGVEALKAATPIDSGLAASSWYYTIQRTKDGAELIWGNTDIENGCNVAILINYGHATKSGTYVQGRYFIEPALEKTFSEFAILIDKEVQR